MKTIFKNPIIILFLQKKIPTDENSQYIWRHHHNIENLWSFSE